MTAVMYCTTECKTSKNQGIDSISRRYPHTNGLTIAHVLYNQSKHASKATRHTSPQVKSNVANQGD